MSQPLVPDNNITHIEIRRVQNGFVVMALNYTGHPFDYTNYMDRPPQRASFVAASSPELGNLVQSIADGMEMNWLPTVDLPLLEMRYWIQSELARVNRLLEKEKSPG